MSEFRNLVSLVWFLCGVIVGFFSPDILDSLIGFSVAIFFAMFRFKRENHYGN